MTTAPITDLLDAEPVEADDESGVGRKAVIWAVVGFLAWATVVAVGTMANGLEPASAVGLGIFVGLWSGLGFGFMMGGTTALSQILEPDQHR